MEQNRLQTTIMPQPEDKMPQPDPSPESRGVPGCVRPDMTARAPNSLLRFFTFEHLPPRLQEVSRPIGELARQMDASLPDGAEKTAGLRKLLEAKDCFVRASLPPV